MEYAYPGSTSAATASANQSFYSSTGVGWTDLTQFSSTANFCIKAFTDSSGPEIDVLGGSPLQSIPSGSPAPLEEDGTLFGSTAVGGSLAHTFTIRNTGTGPLVLDGTPLVEITGAEAGDFAVTSLPTTPVAAGGTTTFEVTFSPSELGFRSTTVNISNNDSDESLYTFILQGTGGTPPAVADDSYDAVRNVALVVEAPGVLGNDEGGGDGLVAVKASDPANGTVALNADGSFSYTSDAGFSGTDSFTYRASNGALQSGEATVTIEVAKPTVTLDVNENGSANFADLRLIYQQNILGVEQTEPAKSNIEDLGSRLDVNENGSANFADLRLIYQQIILGVDQAEPAKTNILNLLP
jgi:hypothetical protein